MVRYVSNPDIYCMYFEQGAAFTEADVKHCLNRVKKILEEEKSLLELSAPIKVVGDMYVSFSH